MECQYCKKIFSTKGNLTNHQKTAKYCLVIQNRSPSFVCSFCTKEFTKANDLKSHNLICLEKVKFDFEIELRKLQEENQNMKKNFEEEIQSMKKSHTEEIQRIKEEHIRDIKELAITSINTPKTVKFNNQRINQVINNLIPLTDDHMNNQIQYLTIEHVKNGIDGYVKYALEHFFKDRIICTDFARRKIKYKNKEGDLLEDPEMTKLAQKFFQTIETKNTELADICLIDIGNRYNNLITELSKDDIDKDILEIRLNSINKEQLKLKNLKTDVKEASKGNNPIIRNDFVKTICKEISS